MSLKAVCTALSWRIVAKRRTLGCFASLGFLSSCIKRTLPLAASTVMSSRSDSSPEARIFDKIESLLSAHVARALRRFLQSLSGDGDSLLSSPS